MKQITKTLGLAFMLMGLSTGGAVFANEKPPTSRLRVWSEIHSGQETVRVATYHSSKVVTYHSSLIRELPAMPGYAVQVGAFSGYENAENFILSLHQKGVGNIYLKKRWVSGKPLYKVVVGPFRERKNAANRRDEIKQFYGVNDGFVVVL